ncbi:MAG: papain-like cysteine peptidase [Treponema sp.]|jgi:ribosomal protein S18|nr:papain-like cysteine peptidase [Treponema sp.]
MPEKARCSGYGFLQFKNMAPVWLTPFSGCCFHPSCGIVKKNTILYRNAMGIRLKNIIKAFLPYGIIILHREYNEYRKYYKKASVQNKFIFDIILSAGAGCRTAHYLKKHDLRFCANPLDWMTLYSLDTVIHLYKTNFDDFFKDFAEDKQKSLEYNGHWYFDTRNNILSLHYGDIENNNELFRKKMKDRFERMHEKLLAANKICFVSYRNDDIGVFRNFLNEMGKIYPGKITCINIRNNEETVIPPPLKYFEEKISEKLELVEYEFKDIHPNGDDLKTNEDAWIGNYIIWDNIMGKISLKKRMNFFSYMLNKNRGF